MFKEFKGHKGIDVPALSKILTDDGSENCSAIVFETPELEASVAIVEFDLILAFKFLVDALAGSGIEMDHYLAAKLDEWDFSFKVAVMDKFVKFRRSNGIKSGEDEEFSRTKDLSIYQRGFR